jgi:hypothetical protein
VLEPFRCWLSDGDLTKAYTDETFDVVSEQIAKAGYRLAALLNAAFNKSSGR